MSYHYQLTGAIGIEPPLNYAEMTEAASKNKTMDAILYSLDPNRRRDVWASVKISLDVSKTVTKDGLLTTFAGSTIEPWGTETNTPVDDLNLIAGLFGRHTFTGYIYGVGEGGDHVRWSIRKGEVITEEAKLVWPDGTVAEVTV